MKTIEQQITCVKREIAMRERMYPYRASRGKMNVQVADYEIATMREVLATLERVRSIEHNWNISA